MSETAVDVCLCGNVAVCMDEGEATRYGIARADGGACVPIMTVGITKVPAYFAAQIKDGVCMLDIDEHLNVGGISLVDIIGALCRVFGLTTKSTDELMELTYFIIARHNKQDIPFDVQKMKITSEVYSFVIQNSQRLSTEIVEFVQSHDFHETLLEDPHALPRPLACLIPVMPMVEQSKVVAPISSAAGWISSMFSGFFSGSSVDETHIRSVLGSSFHPNMKPLFVSSPPLAKECVIATATADSDVNYSVPHNCSMFALGPLQFMIYTPYQYDIFLILLPRDVVSELMSFEDVKPVVHRGEYNARIPVRRWLELIGKIQLNVNDVLKYKTASLEKAKQTSILAVSLAIPTVLKKCIYCGLVTDLTSTSMHMQLLNSSVVKELHLAPGATAGLYGCYIVFECAYPSSPTAITEFGRFDVISEDEHASPVTSIDKGLLCPVYISGEQSPAAHLLRKQCACNICDAVFRNGRIVLPADVKRDDVRAAFTGSQDPYRQLLAFILHLSSETSSVHTAVPPMLLDILQKFSNDFLQLNVQGLEFKSFKRAFLQGSWKQSPARNKEKDVVGEFGPSAVLIGSTYPIIIVDDESRLVDVCTNGIHYFTKSRVNGKRALLLFAKYNEEDVRNFTLSLDAENRTYIHEKSRYDHTTQTQKITSSLSYPPANMTTRADRLKAEKLPKMPLIRHFNPYFYQYELMGIECKTDEGKTYHTMFCYGTNE
jgi:hypothetical protein